MRRRARSLLPARLCVAVRDVLGLRRQEDAARQYQGPFGAVLVVQGQRVANGCRCPADAPDGPRNPHKSLEGEVNRLRRACPSCAATGATWCTDDGPHYPKQPRDVTPWWLWPFATVRQLDDPEGPAMCEEQSAGIVPSFMRGRFVRQPAQIATARAPSVAERFDKATGTAQLVLAGVGVTVLLAAMDLIIHVIVIALGVTAILALSGLVIYLWAKPRRHRAREVAAPAPAPPVTAAAMAALPAPARTVSCELTVLASGSDMRKAPGLNWAGRGRAGKAV